MSQGVAADPAKPSRALTPRELASVSDDELVVRARTDCNALAELYGRHGRVAYGLAVAVLRDDRLAEDVVASSFPLLLRDASSSPQPRTVRGRLLLLVHRTAVARVRAARASVGADEAVQQHASHLLARLPDEERAAVALAYFGGLTLSELAQATGTTRKTVGRLVTSGLTGLGQLSVASAPYAASTPKIVDPTRTSVAPSSAATR